MDCVRLLLLMMMMMRMMMGRKRPKRIGAVCYKKCNETNQDFVEVFEPTHSSPLTKDGRLETDDDDVATKDTNDVTCVVVLA